MSPGAFDRKMCNSSVEPTPSRMSTPKRAFHALPTRFRQRFARGGADAKPRCRPAHSSSSRRSALRRTASARRRRWSGCTCSSARTLPPASAGRSARPLAHRPTSETSMRCRGHRRKTVLPPKGRRRPRDAEHLSGVGIRRRQRDWNADGARPWACRWSPTNRARMRAHRACVGTVANESFSLASSSESFFVTERFLTRHHDVLEIGQPPDDVLDRRETAPPTRTARARGCPPAHRHTDPTSAAY